jgi:excinuclease ABC subunit B
VAILDADKEGFLRSERAFIQTAGRAARNVNGRVILYAEKITASMQKLISETERRRKKQIEYNQLHNITPQTAQKNFETQETSPTILNYLQTAKQPVVLDPVVSQMSVEELQEAIQDAQKKMLTASAKEDFLTAAQYRDEMFALEKALESKKINRSSP